MINDNIIIITNVYFAVTILNVVTMIHFDWALRVFHAPNDGYRPPSPYKTTLYFVLSMSPLSHFDHQ